MTPPPYPYGGPPPPGYPGGYPPGFPGPPPGRPTNTLAIAALVCGILFAPLGIVFGHISLSQIRRTGEEGRGMALAGLIIGYVATALTIVLIVVGVLFAMAVVQSVDNDRLRRHGPTIAAAPGTAIALPPFQAPPNLGASCRYPASPTPAAKPTQPPRSGRVPTDPAEVSASVSTTAGNIGLQLHNGQSPCTVNSFASLAQQGYFDGTRCHRLSTKADLKILQCGDPTGRGTGGPGYTFGDEYPSNQYRLSDPALRTPAIYPRGTVAMAATTGPNRNGSQFYLVYGDSVLPPRYTVFGTIDSAGLATLDAVAARGVAGGGDDGAPAQTVEITSARLD